MLAEAKPPRRVPFSLRAALMANRPALVGSILLSASGVLAVPLSLATDPIGSLTLALGTRDVKGRLLSGEATYFSEGGSKTSRGTSIYRYTYAFDLGDGVEHHGRSYSLGQVIKPPTRITERSRLPRVTIEYAPGRPHISRIKGMRTHPLSSWALLVLLFPAAGALLVWGGVHRSRRQAWLLRWGQMAPGTVTLVTSAGGRGQLPLEWKDEEALRNLFRHQNPLLRAGVPFLKLWTCATIAIMGLGAVLIIVILAGLARGQGPAGGVWAIIGFLLLWVGLGFWMVRVARRTLLGRLPGMEARDPVEQLHLLAERTWQYTFRLPDGTAVQGADSVRWPVSEAIPPQVTVFYDASGPSRSVLFEGMRDLVTANDAGDWTVRVGATAIWRLATIAFLCISGPLAGWLIAQQIL